MNHQTHFYQLLNSIFTNAAIYQDEKHECILIRRRNETPVLIQSYDKVVNVDESEVEAFMKRVDQERSVYPKCNGILISQQCGIALTSHLELRKHDNRSILLFLHNCNMDPTILKQSLDLVQNVDHLVYPTDPSTRHIIEPSPKRHRVKPTPVTCDLSAETLPVDPIPVDRVIDNNSETSTKMACPVCMTFETNNKKSYSNHYRICLQKSKAPSDSTEKNEVAIPIAVVEPEPNMDSTSTSTTTTSKQILVKASKKAKTLELM